MTDELTEAARTVAETHVRGDWTEEGWHDSADGLECLGCGAKWPCPAAMLARAWLAERDPDADLPITEEWLLSIGFVEDVSPHGRSLEHPDVPFLQWLGTRMMIDNPNKGWQNPGITTRGHVLTLLRALGTQGVPR